MRFSFTRCRPDYKNTVERRNRLYTIALLARCYGNVFQTGE